MVTGCLAIAGPTGCHAFARALGHREEPGRGAPLTVRNDADVEVNLYMLGRSSVHLQTVFVGVIGPRTTHTFRIQGTTPGDTVWMRARPVDGTPEFARDDVVLGRGRVWRIP